ncbi:MAG: hypothetical protein WCH04_21895, partial [Gammaproteobacteria bacterium]
HLLKQEVAPQAVKQPMFHLNRLRHGLELPEDSDLDLAAYGLFSFGVLRVYGGSCGSLRTSRPSQEVPSSPPSTLSWPFFSRPP